MTHTRTDVVLDQQGEVRLCYDSVKDEIFFEYFSMFGFWLPFVPRDTDIPDFNEYPKKTEKFQNWLDRHAV